MTDRPGLNSGARDRMDGGWLVKGDSIRQVARHLSLCLGLMIQVACASVTPTVAHRQDVNRQLARGDLGEALRQVESRKETEYGNKGGALYHLDRGALLHFAKRYSESDAELDIAERKIEELHTKSASQSVGRYFANDNGVEYRPPPHEKVLLHILRALNHAMQGDVEGSSVEASKMSAFLTQAQDEHLLATTQPDVFVHVLSQLLFEDAGSTDSAATSARRARASVTQSGALPGLRPEVFAKPLAKGEGEVILIHYSGTAPRIETDLRATALVKDSSGVLQLRKYQGAEALQVLKRRVPLGEPAPSATALPKFVQDPYLISGSRMVIGGREADTAVGVDVTAIAKACLDANMEDIQSRAAWRSLTKDLWSELASVVPGITFRGAAYKTEVADIRAWATMAGQIRIGHVHVPAGRHDMRIVFIGPDGKTVNEERLPGLVVKSGKRTYVQVRTIL